MIQNSKMLIFFCCALLLRTFGSALYDKEDIYDCVRKMACELGDQEAFKRVYNSNIPERKEYLLSLAFDKFGFDRNEPYNPDWSNYMKFICDMPEEKVKTIYEEGLQNYGEFWSKTCESGDIKKCEELDETSVKTTMVVDEKFLNGQCEVGAVKNLKKLNPFG